MLELVRRRTQNFTIIDQEKQNRTTIHLEPRNYQFNYVNIDFTISVEFLLLRGRRPSWRNFPSGEERGETAVFSGLWYLSSPCEELI